MSVARKENSCEKATCTSEARLSAQNEDLLKQKERETKEHFCALRAKLRWIFRGEKANVYALLRHELGDRCLRSKVRFLLERQNELHTRH